MVFSMLLNLIDIEEKKMNKFLLVITPIVVFIFTTFLCFSTYWLGGGTSRGVGI